MDGVRGSVFGPLTDLLITAVAIMAAIILIKLAVSYLPSNGYTGAVKALVNVV